MCSVILGQLESSRNFKGFMHQSIPAAPSPFPGLPRGNCPPCQSWGWRICQPRGQPRAFDTHAVSYQNITTQRILLEKQADWLICQGSDGKKLKRFVKACSRFCACISSLLIKPEFHSKTRELSRWINVFLVTESSFSWYYLKNILSHL